MADGPFDGMFVVVVTGKPWNYVPGTLTPNTSGARPVLHSEPMPYRQAMLTLGEWHRQVESPGWSFKIERAAGDAGGAETPEQ